MFNQKQITARDRRIIEVTEGMNYEVIRNALFILSDVIEISDGQTVRNLNRMIHDLQELESTVKGIPIK